LELETPNIRAAIDYAIPSEPEQALRMGVNLTGWWKVAGQYALGEDALARALEVSDPAPRPLRARALWSLGILTRFRGQAEVGARYVQQAREMVEQVGDPWTEAMSLQQIAVMRSFRDPLGSRPDHIRALELARKVEDPWVLLTTAVTLARSYQFSDEFASAEELLFEADSTRSAIGIETASQTGSGFGICALVRGDFQRCAAGCEEAISASTELGDPIALVVGEMFMAWLGLLQGRAGEVLERMRATEAFVVAKGGFAVVPHTRIEIAKAMAALDDLEAARDLLEAVVAGGADRGWNYSRALLALSDVLGAMGDSAGSLARADEALLLTTRLGSRSLAASARELIARGHMDRGQFAEAEALLHDALADRVGVGAAVWTAPTLYPLAQVAAAVESNTEAARLLGAADGALADLGIARWALDAPRITELEQTLEVRLGSVAFESAHAEGAAMTLAEAVAWVRRARGSRRRPSAGWEALTPTEMQVAELVAQG
ncbi:MAG: hypothetical protein ACRDYC_02595, partial [Acidimicrobiales bacterium]